MSKNIFFDGKAALVVEDELAIADKIAAQLAVLGYAEVLIATTLGQANELLEHNDIDAALLDVNLRGGETTIELGWNLSSENVPVLFFSGFNAEEMARLTRGHEFMEKPISLPRLKAALQRAILRVPAQSHGFMRKKMAGQMARQ